jgi:hypothetical protein
MRYVRFVKVLWLLVPFLACDVCNGQQSTAEFGRPIEGSTGGLYLPNQSQSSLHSDLDPGVKVHSDPYGKRCISVAAFARPKTDFRKIFGAELSAHSSGAGDSKSQNYEHIVSAQNRCSQSIKLKVCYLGSRSCLLVDVPPYGQQQASLGIATGTSAFRYQYTEQF